MINLWNVRDVRYATKSLSYLLLVDRTPVKAKNNNASKKVLNFFKKPPSVKQTTVEGVDAVEVESDNQVPTSSRQHTIESSYRTDTGSTKAEIIWTQICH